MNRKKSRSISMVIIIILLMALNIIFLYESFKEREFISDYLDMYYSQLKINSAQRAKIEQDVTVAFSYGEDEATNFVPYLRKYDYFLSKPLEYKLLKAGILPDFSLMDFGEQKSVVSYEVLNKKFDKLNKNRYSVDYDVSYKTADGNGSVFHRSEIFVLGGKSKKIVDIGKKV